MRSIFTGLGWPFASGSLHVYALPDAALRAELEKVGAPLADLPFCVPQPAENLHATVSRLPWFLAEPDVPPLDDIAAAVGAAVARIQPFTVELGTPEVTETGVLVGGVGEGSWDALVSAVQAAAGALAPERPMPRPPHKPHVSIAYGVAGGDDASVHASLARTDTSGPFQLRVEEVQLLAVRADADRGVFGWDRLATPRLGD